MAIEIKKKQEESPNSFLYRFSKAVQQSGVLKEARKNRFRKTSENRNRRRSSAVYRAQVREQINSLKRAGMLKGTEEISYIKKILRNPKKSKLA